MYPGDYFYELSAREFSLPLSNWCQYALAPGDRKKRRKHPRIFAVRFFSSTMSICSDGLCLSFALGSNQGCRQTTAEASLPQAIEVDWTETGNHTKTCPLWSSCQICEMNGYSRYDGYGGDWFTTKKNKKNKRRSEMKKKYLPHQQFLIIR